MEHYQIADMFGRRQRPVLIPYLKITRDPNNSSIIKALLGLKNPSKAIAKFPYLKILSTQNFGVNGYGLNFNREFGLPVFIGGIPYLSEYRGGVNDVIQCGTKLPVTFLDRAFPLSQNQSLIEAFDTLTFTGLLAADELPQKSWKIEVPREVIQNVLSNNLQDIVIEGQII